MTTRTAVAITATTTTTVTATAITALIAARRPARAEVTEFAGDLAVERVLEADRDRSTRAAATVRR